MRTLDMSRIAPEVKEENIVEAFFSTFLSESIEKLIATVEASTSGTDAYSRFVQSTATQSKLRSATKRLRRAFDRTRIRERIESYTKSIRTSSDSKAGVGGGISASPQPSATLNADFSAANSREEFVEMVIKASHFIDFGEIRGGLGVERQQVVHGETEATDWRFRL